jgi:hypothetical protein
MLSHAVHSLLVEFNLAFYALASSLRRLIWCASPLPFSQIQPKPISREFLQLCVPHMATLTTSSSLGAVFLASVVVFFVYSYVHDKRRNPAGLPYPPGPKGYPIIGNLFDIPNAFIYKRFREMSRELSESPSHRNLSRCRSDESPHADSDIIHLQVFSFHLIVCNTFGVADDLLDKRSSIYSDR